MLPGQISKCALRQTIVAVCVASALLSSAHGQYLEGNIRVRRQQGGGRVQIPTSANPGDARPQLDAGLQGGNQAASMSVASALDAQAGASAISNQQQVRPPKISSNDNIRPASQPAAVGIGGQGSMMAPAMDMSQPEMAMRPALRRPKKPRVRPTKPAYDDDADDADDEDYEAQESRGRRRYPSREHDDDDDEYCADDDDGAEHGDLFRPMRQMTRMMGGVFDQMQSMASGSFGQGSFPPGASNMAMASSTSNSDGYSRMSSLVNNNGRSRGFVTETRNGRTKTQRIGDDQDDDE